MKVLFHGFMSKKVQTEIFIQRLRDISEGNGPIALEKKDALNGHTLSKICLTSLILVLI